LKYGLYIELKTAKGVAPYTGAWIEISTFGAAWTGIKSLPTRERGLKLVSAMVSANILAVAPYTGAWIEIETVRSDAEGKRSLPTRERGLKLTESYS